MEAIIINAITSDESQIEALKAFMKALKIKFKLSKEAPYNPDFMAKILQGDKDFEAGKGISMTMEELEKLCK